MTVKTRSHSYHVEDKDPILKQALRSVLNTLKARAKKNKEKLKDEKRRNKNKQGIFKAFSREEPGETPAPRKKRRTAEPPLNESITVSNNFSRKPLSIEEAIFFLRESGDNAYMFTNVETDKMSVIFYDDSKNISIIEAT
jgi:putative sigma-54 modulation protein